MMRYLKDAADYFWAGVILNACAVWCVYNTIKKDTGPFILFGIFAIVLNLFLGLQKYTVYLRIKKLLIEYGWDEMIVKPKSYSWCDRHATMHACRQTGHLKEYQAFMEREGHKWYHFLPKVHRFGEMFSSNRNNPFSD